MEKLSSIKEILLILEKIENKENLFEKKIKGIYFWKIIRFLLWTEIGIKSKLMEKAHDEKLNKAQRIKKLFLETIVNFFENNDFKKKIIIFELGIFFQENGKFLKKFCFDLIEKLKKEKIEFEVVYPLYSESKYGKENNYAEENYKYVFFKIVGFIKNKFNFFKFSSEDKKYLEKLKKYFEKEAGIKNLEILNEKNFKKILINFECEYEYYTNFFKVKQPEKIYIVCSYGREALIAAAQDLDIEVIELQHGVMTKYHIGYNFPNVKIPYFPDKLLLWGEYWKDNINLPKNVKIELYGYPYLKRQYEKYKNIEKNLNQVIFISQGTIGKRLSEKAIEFAKENPQLKVVYRLHPGEFLRWKKEYRDLYENRNLENLEISDNNEKNLYEYLFESEYLIGVYSTVIYEALELNLKVGVVKLSGSESIEDLIVGNYIKLFEKSEKINIEKLKNLKIIENNFFNKN
ncbi:hypothetical protein M2102_002016 [Fusobacterium sp. PH5-7]|uniref:capsular biosynthesis protein n=1 Tax=Fusobacterium sp. PH5-7 TaxID=2940528 RepID=UPI002473F022|nr:capsular biosynthesis protein [Fusobacterium sp. PH5-7]MDH6458374.1 hypothetical protein [Fusobacterium sp. PH5-7]